MVRANMTDKPQQGMHHDVNLHSNLQHKMNKQQQLRAGGSLKLSVATGRKLSSANLHHLSDTSNNTSQRANKKALRASRTLSSIISPPSVATTTNSNRMLQGNLRKQERGILKRCKKRWFILSETDSYIRYYSPTQSGSVLGEISLCNVIDVRQLTNDKGPRESPYGFQITTPERAYYLFAETPEERQYWCDGLNAHLETIRKAASIIAIKSLNAPAQSSTRSPKFSTSPYPNNPSSNTSSYSTSHNNSNCSSSTTPTNSPRNRPLTRSQSFTHQSMDLNNKVISVHAGTGTMIVSAEDDKSIRIQTPIVNHKQDFSKIRKTDSFSTTGSPSNSINLVCTPNSNAINIVCAAQPPHPRTRTAGGGATPLVHHKQKKSSGKIQDDINEYVKISMWLQQQERERLLKEAEKLKEEQTRTLQQLEEEKKKVELLTALHRQAIGTDPRTE